MESEHKLDPLNMSSPNADSASPKRFDKSKRRRLILIALFIVMVSLLTIIAAIFWPTKSSAPSQATPSGGNSSEKKVSQKSTIRLIASGDTIAHDALNLQAKQADGTYDYYQFMEPLQPFFDEADVKFCNQAVPGGGPAFGIRGYPIFNSPFEVARDLNKLGCNVLNTGTNHTFDLGQSVINAQLDDLDKLPDMLAVAGANRTSEEQQKVRYFEVDKVKFAFLSYSTYSNITPPNSFGLNMYSEALAKPQITEARQQADIVIVSMRWGTEYSPAINPLQDQIAQQLSDWGTDVVLGHGPHVLQPVKQLTSASGRKTTVWYSLGNFLNAQLETEALVSGLAVIDIDIKTKVVQPPKYLPIYMHYEWSTDEMARQELLKRKAFTMQPLDLSTDLLAKSQLKTNVGDQTTRVTQLLNQFSPVEMLTSKTY